MKLNSRGKNKQTLHLPTRDLLVRTPDISKGILSNNIPKGGRRDFIHDCYLFKYPIAFLY